MNFKALFSKHQRNILISGACLLFGLLATGFIGIPPTNASALKPIGVNTGCSVIINNPPSAFNSPLALDYFSYASNSSAVKGRPSIINKLQTVKPTKGSTNSLKQKNQLSTTYSMFKSTKRVTNHITSNVVPKIGIYNNESRLITLPASYQLELKLVVVKNLPNKTILPIAISPEPAGPPTSTVVPKPAQSTEIQNMPESGQSVAVSAMVQAHTYLVVDNMGQIIQIFNNSPQESEPVAVLGSLSGQVSQFSTDIATQYQAIKLALDFSKYGLVYQKSDFLTQAYKSNLVLNNDFYNLQQLNS